MPRINRLAILLALFLSFNSFSQEGKPYPDLIKFDIQKDGSFRTNLPESTLLAWAKGQKTDFSYLGYSFFGKFEDQIIGSCDENPSLKKGKFCLSFIPENGHQAYKDDEMQKGIARFKNTRKITRPTEIIGLSPKDYGLSDDVSTYILPPEDGKIYTKIGHNSNNYKNAVSEFSAKYGKHTIELKNSQIKSINSHDNSYEISVNEAADSTYVWLGKEIAVSIGYSTINVIKLK